MRVIVIIIGWKVGLVSSRETVSRREEFQEAEPVEMVRMANSHPRWYGIMSNGTLSRAAGISKPLPINRPLTVQLASSTIIA